MKGIVGLWPLPLPLPVNEMCSLFPTHASGYYHPAPTRGLKVKAWPHPGMETETMSPNKPLFFIT